jgi:hypothetical protein
MNKVGKYAKGGVVQRFAKGATGTGVKTTGDIPFDKVALPHLSKLDATILRLVSTMDKVTLGGMSKLMVGLDALGNSFIGGEKLSQRYQRNMVYLNSVLPSFSAVLDSNAKYNKRSSLLQMELVDSIALNIREMQKSGATQSQVRKAAIDYINNLARNSKALGAPVPKSVAPSVAPTPVPTATKPQSGFSTMGGTLGAKATQTNTNAIDSNTQANNNAAKAAMSFAASNKMMAASMTTSLLQGFLPAVDENSSSLLIMTQSLLGFITIITSVGFALEAFGISLTRTSIGAAIDNLIAGFNTIQSVGIVNFIKSIFMQTTATAAQSTATVAGTVSTVANTVSTSANTAATNVNTTAQLTAGQKLSGGLMAGAAAAAAVTAGFYVYLNALKEGARIEKERAIKSGDVTAAGEAAANEASWGVRETFGTVGAAIGGTVGAIAGTIAGGTAGSIVPFAGTAAGATVGGVAGGAGGAVAGGGIGLAIADLAGFTQEAADFARLQGESAARFSKVTQLLEKSSATAAASLDKLSSGTISARDALDSVSEGTQATVDLIQSVRATNKAAEDLASQRWFFKGSAMKNAQSEGKERLTEAKKQASTQLSTLQPMLNAQMRNVSFSGGDFDAFLSSLSDAEFELLNLADDGIKNAYQSFVNISKEVEMSKQKFAALSLGFRNVTSASDAAALKMSGLMSSFEVGTIPAIQAAATLEAALTSAGQNITEIDFNKSLTEINSVFKAFGASDKQIGDFNNLLKGVAGVQKQFPSIFEELKTSLSNNQLKDINNPAAVGDKFKEIVSKQLEGSGIDKAAREKILAAMGDVKLTPDDVNQIISGDYSVLEKYLGDAAEEVKKNMKAVVDNYVKVQQDLINATKARIDAERNLVEAQKEALDLTLEGREVQAKYGGKVVSYEERRANILGKSNVEGNRLGLTAMRTGSIQELRARNAEISGGFANIERRRQEQNGMAGQKGVEADAQQKDLEKAYKTQVDTIRNLIKLEEEQLKVTQEKIKLERESMESLVKGDVEEFFKKQSAVGATAAIASGDQRLMRLYGADALGMAYQDIQRQQEAGVQSLYGQQLAGPGGLTEAAAGAALSARGVTDMRATQVMAGTTAEEEASKSRLRELGGILGETGQTGVQMAEMQVATANLVVEKATLVVTNLQTGGNAPEGEPPVAMRSGGMIYANRGIFVPRGTDTVPAMLTPGEFVVNRAAVQRGNNLSILKAMNNGSGGVSNSGGTALMSRGGTVRYLANGGNVGTDGGSSGMFENMSRFVTAISNFNSDLSNNIDKLGKTTINIKLDTTTVNVNLNDGGLLRALTDKVKTELMGVITSKLYAGNDGKLTENNGVLPRSV